MRLFDSLVAHLHPFGAVALAVLSAGAAQFVLGPDDLVASAAAAAVLLLGFAWRPVDGVLGFAILVLLADPVTHWTGLDLRYIDELTVPAFVIAAGTVHRRRLVITRPGMRTWSVIALLASAIASSLVNAVPAHVWVPGIALLGKGFAFFYLLSALRIGDGEFARTLRILFVVSISITTIGLVQFVLPEVASDLFRLPPFAQQRGEIGVVNSVFSHPALYGWLTAALSLFLYARFVVVQDRWAVLIAAIASLGVVASGRRAPVIGLLAGLLLGTLRGRGQELSAARRWGPALIVVAIVALFSLPVLGGFYGETLARYSAPPGVIAEVFAENPRAEKLSSLQPRIALYAGSVAIARDDLPLGAGVGRFGSHMSRAVYSPTYAEYGLDQIYGLSRAYPIAVTDSFWPMILGETGVVGLVAALIFFGSLARDLWAAAGLSGPPTTRIFMLGTLLLFAEGLVRSLISAAFVAPPIAYFLLGAAGMSVAYLTRHRATEVGASASYGITSAGHV